MSLIDLFRMGAVNLLRRKTRTLLTALSMTIGVMCIIVLISVGLGYEKAYSESLEQMGSLTKIDVLPANDLGGKTALLNDTAVEQLKKLDGVEAVTPVVQSAAYVKCGNYINMIKLYGIDLETAAAFLIVPEEGTSPAEGIHMRPEVMVTDDVARTFSNPGDDWNYAIDENGNALVDPLNNKIKLTFDYSNLSGQSKEDADGRALPGGKFYTLDITGVCSTMNNSFTVSAFLDKGRLQEWLDANADYVGRKSEEELEQEKKTGTNYNLVWVKVKNVNDVQGIVKIIQNAGLQTYSLNDMLETVRTQSRQIQGMLGAIGAVSVFVSALCVANTMMMSINERTREVGVLKVLGTELSDIVKMFLIEALIVGIIGGISGLCLSYVMKAMIPILFADMDIQSVIPLWLAVLGVVFSGAVALISAIIPALKAMRISPNEAIRTE